jgi:hypothetical protein
MKANEFSKISQKRTLVLFSLFICLLTCSLNAQQQNAYTDAVILNKTFPFIASLKENPEVLKMIQNDANIKKQILQHKERIELALNQCKDVTCYASAVQWTQNEIVAIGNDLIRLSQKSNSFKDLISSLKTSGYYSLSASNHDTGFVRIAWNSAASGINKVLDVYIKGTRPFYANIDSISFSKNDKGFQTDIQNILANEAKNMEGKAFFEIPVNLALDALQINKRDEAARYEPLTGGMNESAFKNIKNIKWDNYQYSIMLIPGQGPEQEGVIIDSLGIVRCKLAAQRYKEGLAPFIVVSGGHVHPYKTIYCEAVEMKKYLVKELGIPENVIFIEPHARHTTTNIRNAARMVYRFNIPSDKKIVIVTNSDQNNFLLGMEKRFMREIGSIPYRDMKKLNEEMTEYYPVRDALQCNPLDPLDP